MSFSADIFNKKLAALQETQESIVTISQWVLFHHRHSKELAELWSTFITRPQNDSAKRLSLFYLCNDVVQQARHKRKPDFINEFAKVLPIVFNKCYKSIDDRIKPKVDRLINVWEQRNVFSAKDVSHFRKSIELSKQSKSISDASNEDKPDSSNISKEVVASDLKNLNNAYLHMNQLIDIGQANLKQVGVQSNTYLPGNPGMSDNLPSPKIYISKLNTLERLCDVSKKNIEDIKSDRKEIIKILDNLKKLVTDALSTDDSKLNIINGKLESLFSTRSELKEILNDDEQEEPSETKAKTSQIGKSENTEVEEEPSPAFDDGDDDDNPGFVEDDEDDDMIPSYENDDDDESGENGAVEDINSGERTVKRQKTSGNTTPNQTPTPGSTSGSSTPSHKKSVAFSENIEIKEYDREEQTEIIKIVRSDEDNDENQQDSDGDVDLDDPEDFEKHHKDVLELKHEREQESPSKPENDDEDDGYDPLAGVDDEIDQEDGIESNNAAVLDILSKLK